MVERNEYKTAADDKLAGERRLRPFDAICLSVGCAVGWGAFSLPASSFLPQAGPLGAVVALVIGTAIVLVITCSYHYMANKMPFEGGAYVYAGRTFGRAHGFVCAWALMLAYLMIVAINVSALTVVARDLFGGLLEVGPNYVVFGYRVYFYEVFASVVVIALVVLLASRDGSPLRFAFDGMAAFLVVGVLAVAILVAAHVAGSGADAASVAASFDGRLPLGGVVSVIAVAPFLFVGFDAIPQMMGKMSFSPRKVGPLMAASVVLAALVYLALALVTGTAVPDGFATWFDYFQGASQLSGVEASPTFYAASETLGLPGLVVLEIAAVCAILTGLIGFLLLTARMACVMAKAGALSPWFAQRGRSDRTPSHAMLFVAVAALVLTLLGRTALTWIVDVSSIGAAIAFAYTSAAAFKHARAEGSRLSCAVAALGFVLSVAFIVALVVPLPIGASALDSESYVVLAAWIALGINFYDPAQSVS